MEAGLKWHGAQVLRTNDPTGNIDVPLFTRTNKANAWGADVYVSIHHNANTGSWGDGTGVETYIYTSPGAKSEELAACIHSGVVSAMEFYDRGVKKKDLYIVRETKMPTVLTEGGYMDSRVDIKTLRGDSKLKVQGINIAYGIHKYFGVTPKPLANSSAAAAT